MALKKAINKTTPKAGTSKNLKEQASKNVRVSRKVGREPETIVKAGVSVDHAPKHNMNKGTPDYNPKTVGISFGLTLNMGDYESLRVDCWLTDSVGDNETQEEALVRLGDIAQKQVEYEVDRVKKE
jgi:hypothetical protein